MHIWEILKRKLLSKCIWLVIHLTINERLKWATVWKSVFWPLTLLASPLCTTWWSYKAMIKNRMNLKIQFQVNYGNRTYPCIHFFPTPWKTIIYNIFNHLFKAFFYVNVCFGSWAGHQPQLKINFLNDGNADRWTEFSLILALLEASDWSAGPEACESMISR